MEKGGVLRVLGFWEGCSWGYGIDVDVVGRYCFLALSFRSFAESIVDDVLWHPTAWFPRFL